MRTFFIFGLLVFLRCVSVFAQSTVPGDINGDRIIDGADALILQNVLAEEQTLTGEEFSRADVFPAPDPQTPSRGDDQLTSQDLDELMRLSVRGVASQGSATVPPGDRPVIDWVDPLFAFPGNQVGMEGYNFIGEDPRLNIVYFGSRQATVNEADPNRLIVDVPEGFSRGIIRVQTPNGEGQAIGEFDVVRMVPGTVDWPGTIGEDYVVYNPYDIQPLGTDGSFEIAMPDTRVVIIHMHTDAEVNNSLMAVRVPRIDTSQPYDSVEVFDPSPIEISPRTTAEALVFSHPFLITQDVDTARMYLETMQTISEIDELADRIAERYPQGADGLADPAIEEALVEAMVAFMDALPDGYLVSLTDDDNVAANLASAQAARRITNQTTPPIRATPNQFLDDLKKPVQVYNLDSVFTTAEYFPVQNEFQEIGRVELGLRYDYSPLDWTVSLDRLDPDDMPKGVFNASRDDHFDSDYDRLNFTGGSVIPGNFWSGSIDLLYNLVTGAENLLFPGAPPSVPVDTLEDGVYMIRCFSGAILHPEEGFEWAAIRTQRDGVELASIAVGSNLIMLSADLFDLFTPENQRGLRKFLRKTKKKLQPIINDLIREPSEVSPGILMTAALEFGLAALEAYPTILANDYNGRLIARDGRYGARDLNSEILYKSPPKALKISERILGVVARSFNVLGRVAAYGRVAERLAGMLGVQANPADLFAGSLSSGPSPLEMYFVVVGDPFKPEILDIEPRTVGIGDSVFISASGLPASGEECTVIFDGIEATEKRIGEDGRLEVVVPEGIEFFRDNRSTFVGIELQTIKSTSTAQDTRGVQIFNEPAILDVSPREGYAAVSEDSDSPFAGYSGETVTLEGVNLDDTELEFYVGDVRVSAVESSQNSYVRRLLIPEGVEPGEVIFTIRDGEGNEYTNRNLPFDVLGPPEVTSIQPARARIGQFMFIEGANLERTQLSLANATSRTVFSATDSLGFTVFDYIGEPETEITIQIDNPAGSTTTSFTVAPSDPVEPGENPFVPPTVSEGLEVVVTDSSLSTDNNGMISLVEAFQLIDGSSTELLDRDDVNERWTEIWVERRVQIGLDNNGDPIYQNIIRQEDTIKDKLEPEGLSQHETREVYRETRYRDGRVTTELIETINLDEGPATEDVTPEMEEADYITGDVEGGYNGSRQQDSVSISGNGTFLTHDISLGIMDTLSGGPVEASGDIQLRDGSRISLSRLVLGEQPLTINGNGVTVNVPELVSGSSEEALRIENSFGSSIETSIQSENGDGIRINGGEFNTVEAVVSTPEGTALLMDRANQNSINLVANLPDETGAQIQNSSSNRLLLSVEQGARNGVVLEGGAGNWISVDVNQVGSVGIHLKNTLSNDLDGTVHTTVGPGVLLENSTNNSLDVEVDSAAVGVELIGSRGNQLTGSIVNSSRTGLRMQNSIANTSQWVTLSGNRSGIHLLESRGNQFESITVSQNREDGLILDEDSVMNSFDHLISHGNRNGAVIRGSGTRANQFEHCHFGSYDNEVDLPLPNTEHGIVFEDGARNNQIIDCDILYNAQNGIVFQTRAQRNWVLDETVVEGNGQHGILLDEQAHENVIYSSNLFGNAQHGILLQGAGVTGTVIDRCEIGATENDFSRQSVPNGGFGVRLVGTQDVRITNNAIAENTQGGLYFENVSNPSDAVILDRNRIGYIQSGNTFDRITNPILTAGIGIQVLDSEGLSFPDHQVFGYGVGILLDGVEASSFDEAIAHNASSVGWQINNSSNLMLTFANAAFCPLGVHILNSQQIDWINGNDPTSYSTGALENGRTGFLVEGSEDVLLRNMDSTSNGEDGFHIVDSSFVTLQDIFVFTSGRNAVTVESSEFVDIIRGSLEDSAEDGIHIAGSNGVRLAGDAPREGLFVFNQGDDGIEVLNSTAVDIGMPNQGVNVSGSGEYGITLTGGSNGISMESGIVMQSAEGGIRIEDVRNVTVGGLGANEGNYIEFHADRPGIEVVGPEADALIQYNTIGQPEEFESDLDNGNLHGIQLTDATEITITNNFINRNVDAGILITGSSTRNLIQYNTIRRNGENGIRIVGDQAVSNQISQNAIYDNEFSGISLEAGGNGEPQPPVITQLKWAGTSISGEVDAPNGSIVEVFVDREDEGEEFVGRGPVAGGTFTVNGEVIPGWYYRATVTDPEFNTSEFGFPYLFSSSTSVLFVEEESGSGNIVFYNGQERASEVLINHPADDRDPAVSPNGRQILFSSDRNGTYDLFLYDSQNGSTDAFQASESNLTSPAWHPGAGDVLFVSDEAGQRSIVTMGDSGGTGGALSYFPNRDPDTGVFNMTGDISGVHFTTDVGSIQRFDFYIFRNPNPFRWKILSWDESEPGDEILAEGMAEPTATGWFPIELEEPIQVPTDFVIAAEILSDDAPEFGGFFSFDISPRSWQQTGTDFRTWFTLFEDLYIRVFTGGEGGMQSVIDSVGNDDQPVWHPDGDRFAFVSDRDGNKDIWIAEADGQNPEPVTRNPSNEHSPAWSPDGTQLVFVSDRNGTHDIFSLTLGADSHVPRVVDNFDHQAPVWSDNGDAILFASNRGGETDEIYHLPLDDTGIETITLTGGDAIQPQSGFTGDVIENSQSPSERQRPIPSGPVIGTLRVNSRTVDTLETIVLPLQIESEIIPGSVLVEVFYENDVMSLLNATAPDNSLSPWASNPRVFPSGRGSLLVHWMNDPGSSLPDTLVDLNFVVERFADPGESSVSMALLSAYDQEQNPVQFSLSSGTLMVNALDDPGTRIAEWMLF